MYTIIIINFNRANDCSGECARRALADTSVTIVANVNDARALF